LTNLKCTKTVLEGVNGTITIERPFHSKERVRVTSETKHMNDVNDEPIRHWIIIPPCYSTHIVEECVFRSTGVKKPENKEIVLDVRTEIEKFF